MKKFEFAEDYGPQWVALLKQMCVTILPELYDCADRITIVGGAVPSLLLGESLPPDVPAHVGSIDLDLCLALTVGSQQPYTALVERLEKLGFERGSTSDVSKGTRWKRSWEAEKTAIVDLLPIPAAGHVVRSAAVPALGDSFVRQLRLALRDRLKVAISGKSLAGVHVAVEAWVCGPGAYVLIKALTFDDRGRMPKDAYDMFYVLRNYGDGVGDVVARLAPLLSDIEARRGLKVLEDYFLDENDEGPEAVAVFLHKKPNAEIQAEVVSFVRQLLQSCGVNPA